jgi:site-specific recombinase XerD
MVNSMDIDLALRSWVLDLRAEKKSPRTIETYSLAVTQLDDWLVSNGRQVDVTKVTKADIREFIGHMLDTRSDATARQRFGSLSVFFTWLTDEEEIEENPMTRLRAPKVEEKPIEVVSEKHFQILVDSCDASLTGRRDAAILWLLWDTGMRLGEISTIRMEDVSWEMDYITVSGKTGIRNVPFTIETARTLNRYMRFRDKSRFSDSEMLWLGERGPLTYRGISQMLTRKCEQLDLPHINPHRFRHTATDRLLSLGLNEGDTMTIMGWSPGSRSMLHRYGASQSQRRAFEAYRKVVG